MMSLERYGWFQNIMFHECCSELFEGKSDDLVVQLYYVSGVKINRLEGDSSGADSKMSCIILGCLSWENMWRSWGNLL
jgi:hypothetical protein